MKKVAIIIAGLAIAVGLITAGVFISGLPENAAEVRFPVRFK